MANVVYTASKGEEPTGGDSGVDHTGTTEFILTTNTTLIDVTDTTASYSSAEYDLGPIPIAGKRVTVGIEVDANSVPPTNVAATTTFEFDGVLKAGYDGASITLIDGYGTSKTYYGRTTAVRADEFAMVSSADTTGDNFIALVNGANGHNGTITATIAGSDLITLTQVVKGIKGNTLITADSNFDNCCTGDIPDAAFTGGGDIDMYVEFSPTGDWEIPGDDTSPSTWTKFDPYGGTGNLIYDHTRFNPTGVSVANDLTLGSGSFSVHSLDLRAINAPFIRLGMNSQNRTLDGSLTFTFNLAYPAEYDRGVDKETWSDKGERN